MQNNLFLNVLLHCKNEQLEPYVKYSITAILNHYLKNFQGSIWIWNNTFFMNKYKQNKLSSTFDKNFSYIIMRSRVDSQPGYHTSCIVKGETPNLLENYLYLNFPKYGTNGVILLLIILSLPSLSWKGSLKVNYCLTLYISSVRCVNTHYKDCLNWLNPFISCCYI